MPKKKSDKKAVTDKAESKTVAKKTATEKTAHKKANTRTAAAKSTKNRITKQAGKSSKTASSNSKDRRPEHNRRRAPRAACNLKIDFRDVDAFVSSKIMNISPTGIYLNTRKPPSQWEDIHLEFVLPGEPDPIYAVGDIVWVNPRASEEDALPFGIGIHFSKIERKDLQRIEGFVNTAATLNDLAEV